MISQNLFAQAWKYLSQKESRKKHAKLPLDHVPSTLSQGPFDEGPGVSAVDLANFERFQFPVLKFN